MNNEKVIILTGGTGYLGREIAGYLSRAGNRIYIPVQNLDKFRDIFDKSQREENYTLNKIFGFECNATDSKSVKDFTESVSKIEKGKIDCLINTVGGIHKPVNIDESDDDILDKIFNLNFRSAYNFSKEAAKIMKANKYGRIISISSLASLKASGGLFYYSMTKSAINLLMETMSVELKQFDIRCNTIIPGIIDTPANREWGSKDDFKKWVKPDEIAKIISHLISGDFDSVHSSKIKVLGYL